MRVIISCIEELPALASKITKRIQIESLHFMEI